MSDHPKVGNICINYFKLHGNSIRWLLSSLFFKLDDEDSFKRLNEGVTENKLGRRDLDPGRLAQESTLKTVAVPRK